VSLSDLGLIRYQVVTPGQTDRIPIANTCSQQYMPVQLWRVKIGILLCVSVLEDAHDNYTVSQKKRPNFETV